MKHLPIAITFSIALFVASFHPAQAAGWTTVGTNTSTTDNVGIGTTSPSYQLHGVATGSGDGFNFTGSTATIGERDTFTVYDADLNGVSQDESSILKVIRDRFLNDGADGYSLLELTHNATLPSVDNRHFYMLGRAGAGSDEGQVAWGIGLTNADFWTQGSIRGGATGTDCGGTGADCFNSPTFVLSADSDSYVTAGKFGIGTTSPAEALDVNGNIQASGTICDSVGCISSGSASPWTTSGSDIYYSSGNVGVGTSSPSAGLHVSNTDGALFDGTYGTGSATASGAGTRMMWYPGKAAFRAGYVSDTQWDDASIGNYSVAMGINNTASNEGATSFGQSNSASGENATAIGFGNNVSGNGSIGLGYNNTASGNSSIAMGDGSDATGYLATAIGNEATASGQASTAFANGTASGGYSFAQGYQNQASGNYAVAVGAENTASGDTATVFGGANIASGSYSTAAGIHSTAQAYDSFVVGRYNTVTGDTATWTDTDPLFVIGNGSSSMSNNALTVYKNGNAQLDGTFTATNFAGENSTASGGWAVALGDRTEATGTYATALGSGSIASGTTATALGGSTEASGASSTAMGSNTVASGSRSTAIGSSTTASANYSTAMGDDTTASGNFSTSIGRYTTAESSYSLVMGRYNETSTGYSGSAWDSADPLFVIGNGSSSSDLNDAFVVHKNGEIKVTGDITSDGEICIGSGC